MRKGVNYSKIYSSERGNIDNSIKSKSLVGVKSNGS